MVEKVGAQSFELPQWSHLATFDLTNKSQERFSSRNEKKTSLEKLRNRLSLRAKSKKKQSGNRKEIGESGSSTVVKHNDCEMMRFQIRESDSQAKIVKKTINNKILKKKYNKKSSLKENKKRLRLPDLLPKKLRGKENDNGSRPECKESSTDDSVDDSGIYSEEPQKLTDEGKQPHPARYTRNCQEWDDMRKVTSETDKLMTEDSLSVKSKENTNKTETGPFQAETAINVGENSSSHEIQANKEDSYSENDSDVNIVCRTVTVVSQSAQDCVNGRVANEANSNEQTVKTIPIMMQQEMETNSGSTNMDDNYDSLLSAGQNTFENGEKNAKNRIKKQGFSFKWKGFRSEHKHNSHKKERNEGLDKDEGERFEVKDKGDKDKNDIIRKKEVKHSKENKKNETNEGKKESKNAAELEKVQSKLQKKAEGKEGNEKTKLMRENLKDAKNKEDANQKEKGYKRRIEEEAKMLREERKKKEKERKIVKIEIKKEMKEKEKAEKDKRREEKKKRKEEIKKVKELNAAFLKEKKRKEKEVKLEKRKTEKKETVQELRKKVVKKMPNVDIFMASSVKQKRDESIKQDKMEKEKVEDKTNITEKPLKIVGPEKHFIAWSDNLSNGGGGVNKDEAIGLKIAEQSGEGDNNMNRIKVTCEPILEDIEEINDRQGDKDEEDRFTRESVTCKQIPTRHAQACKHDVITTIGSVSNKMHTIVGTGIVQIQS